MIGLKPKYEEHHRCKYTDMAVRAAVLLSERYLSGRFLPDKAIDLLDEAGAKARISMMHQPPQLTQLEGQIEEARVAKEESIGRQEYEKAAKLRDTEKNLRDDLQRQRSEWENHKDENQPIVDEEDIANIVAKQTGIPVTRLTEGETQKVLKMEDALRTKIIGQDEALSTVCRAIRRSRADIKRPQPPDRRLPVPRPHRRGKNTLGTASGIAPVWRRRCAHPGRHVGIHGEIRHQPHDRIASGVCRIRGRRTAHRTSAPASLLRRSF
ncbi:MAG: ATP-dependent Clp protease ATP-binding protein, partial [Parachlamydiales bacterium]|nr:ATP-dependent Clp protease ATP-binding protein [Parachlamydiales bacterium]